MNNAIIHTFVIYGLVRLFAAIYTRPIPIPNPESPQIASTALNFDNTSPSFHHYLKNYLSHILLSTIPTFRIHLVNAAARGCVKISCEISFCSHTFANLKEKLDHSISQVFIFYGVIF